MSFRNPLLLAGLAAAVLPIVLHLLGRAWARPLPWGATLFLQGDAGDTAAGRLRDRALLAVRCAAIAFLALALARPVAPDADAAEAGKIVILVVDASPSTLHIETSTTRFELIRRAALDRLGRLRQGDQAALIVLGIATPADVGLTPDLQAVASQVASLTTGPLPADLAEGERRARAILSDNAIDGGEIDFIADRQRSTWDALRQRTPDTAAGGPRIIPVPIGTARNDNAGIEAVELLNPPAIAGRPARFEIRLRNDGDVPQSDLTLRLSLDRGGPTAGGVAIDAHGRSRAYRTLTPERPGPAVVTATLTQTGVPDDDTFRQSIDVLPVPRAKAIRPSAAASQPTNLLAGVDVAIVSDTPPDLATLAAIEQFVAGGGGLLIAPGPSLSTDAWNQRFWKSGFGLAPAAAADVADHPPLRPVGIASFLMPPDSAMNWTNVPIVRHWRLTPGASETVVARIGNDPLVIERRFGRGRVITLAVPLSGAWASGGAAATYRGLLDTLLPRLIALPADRNVDIGIPLESTLKLNRDRNVTVVRPDGRSDRVGLTAVGGQGAFRYTRTDLPGRYTVRGADQPAEDWFVRPDPGETNLTLLSDGELAEILRAAAIETGSVRPVPPAEGNRSVGLLAAVGVLLALEVLLTNAQLPRRGRA